MVTSNSNLLCREAEPYYYDFLDSESRRLVPESIIDHIKQCQCCQEQIEELKEVLSQVGLESEQKQIRTAVTDMLELHLAYIGKRVTCNITRPFLPSLLDPALKIRIPTPITAHLDNCIQCREDLETIQGLNLNRNQLSRLSRFFVDKPTDDAVSCSTVRPFISSVAAMEWEGVTTETLKSLLGCRACRWLLYEKRQEVIDSLPEKDRASDFPCESVLETDIFDYCFPYGLDPVNDQYAKFRPALTSHLRSCPTCLAKMQELHKTICAIDEQPESGAITIYTIDKSAKSQAVYESDDLYAGFPIKVEVTNPEDKTGTEELAAVIDSTVSLREKVSAMKYKPFIKAAAAAAAIIMIASFLLFYTPTAKAISIEQIYKAIEKVTNVYIAKFVPGRTESTQEKWVSKTLNIYMIKTEKELVLWNISNGIRKSKYTDTGAVETTRLTIESIERIEKKLSGSLGLMPFDNMSELPSDAQWARVIDEGLEIVGEDVEVYDLTWRSEGYDGSVVFKKWRVFVSAKKNLLQRTEYYEKVFTDSEYTLSSVMEIEYLSDSEMQSVLEETSF